MLTNIFTQEQDLCEFERRIDELENIGFDDLDKIKEIVECLGFYITSLKEIEKEMVDVKK